VGPFLFHLFVIYEVMNLELQPATTTDFVQALQKAKAAQDLYKKKSWDDRADFLRSLAEQISMNQSKISLKLSTEQKLPLEFSQVEIVDAIQKFIENLHLEVRLFARPETLRPSGVMGASFSKGLVFLRAFLAIVKSLAAGNAIIISLPQTATVSGQLIKSLLEQAQVPENLVQLLIGNEIEISKLLAAHPGLSAFQFYGSLPNAETLMGLTTQRKKKAQFFLGAKNSCLIHPDFDFEKNKDLILNPFLIGSGQLDINCHRLFISQKVEKDFYEFLKSVLKNKSCDLWSDAELVQFNKSVDQVGADSGHILFGGRSESHLTVQPTWTRDLSNCSEMQQHQLVCPLFIVTAVKYTHEMIKWSNTGYLGHSAVVLAPDKEKAMKLAEPLEVGHVHINEWSNFTRMGTPSKQSFWGNPDESWSGSFYNDVKKIH